MSGTKKQGRSAPERGKERMNRKSFARCHRSSHSRLSPKQRHAFSFTAMFHHFKEPIMITDGHMQYLFDEKGKRYAEKEGFLFRFSFFLRRRRRRRRSTSSSLMKLPPSFFFQLPSRLQLPRRLRRDRHRLGRPLPPAGPQGHPGSAGKEREERFLSRRKKHLLSLLIS